MEHGQMQSVLQLKENITNFPVDNAFSLPGFGHVSSDSKSLQFQTELEAETDLEALAELKAPAELEA